MEKRPAKSHKEWRDAVLARDDMQCVICGNGPRCLNAHHLVPANFAEFRFEVNNGISLCPHCHTLGKWSAHKNPIWFYEWMLHNRPKALQRAIGRMIKLQKDENTI